MKGKNKQSERLSSLKSNLITLSTNFSTFCLTAVLIFSIKTCFLALVFNDAFWAFALPCFGPFDKRLSVNYVSGFLWKIEWWKQSCIIITLTEGNWYEEGIKDEKEKKKAFAKSVAPAILQLTLHDSHTSCKTTIQMRCRYGCELIWA